MSKQAILDVLRDALNDTKPIGRKLQAMLRDQNIALIDAPYGLITGLERLESFREDMRNAISEITKDEQVSM